MADPIFVRMYQDDLKQLDQIITEYEGDPAKGIAHGVQKDAIQNGLGARRDKDLVKSFKNKWSMNFELVEIEGKYALAFWDEGTWGLTGDIIDANEIASRAEANLLGENNADQRLSRFLSRFISGGNAGPGSFGRGKLIFQAASITYHIAIDSFRSSDNEYIFLERKIKGKELQQYDIPLRGDEAKKKLFDITKGLLKPLKAHGTRILILGVKDEVVNVYKKSFEKDADSLGYEDTFAKMIEETWWEILSFGAEINLFLGTKKKTIQVTDPLKSILTAKEKKDGFRVYSKDNISVVFNGDTHYIKHLRFIVSPKQIQDELREFWVQRKRMKIGKLSKGLQINHKISKVFTGYVILDNKLEDEFEKKEGSTHYGFNLRGKSAIHAVQEVVAAHLDVFQQSLGLKVESTQSKARQEMLDTLKELNGLAQKLGLPTDFSSGETQKEISIHIVSFALPNNDSVRIEIGDTVGPVVYEIKNNSTNKHFLKLRVIAEQTNKSPLQLLEKDFDVDSTGTKAISLPAFKVTLPDYENGNALLLRAIVESRKTKSIVTKISRILWIGIDPASKPKEEVSASITVQAFPRTNSKRVELNEFIRNVGLRLTNNMPFDVDVKFEFVVRKSKTSSEDVRLIKTLVKEDGLRLAALSDKNIIYGDIKISEDLFGDIFEISSTSSIEKRCEIFVSVRAAKSLMKGAIPKGQQLSPKKSVLFYCGIDPEGMSIFKGIDEKEDFTNGKRAWAEGSSTDGYIFVLNIGHASFIAHKEDDDYRRLYIRDLMLFQAYLLCLKGGIFKGPAEQFEDLLRDDNTTPFEVVETLDTIVGTAINEIG